MTEDGSAPEGDPADDGDAPTSDREDARQVGVADPGGPEGDPIDQGDGEGSTAGPTREAGPETPPAESGRRRVEPTAGAGAEGARASGSEIDERDAEGSDSRHGPGSSETAGTSDPDRPGVDDGDTDVGPEPAGGQPPEATGTPDDAVPEDVRSYDRFQKVDRASYDRVNEFLRDRTYVTAREWAIARLCADFRTATGVEMTKIGEHLPELVPFMTDTYSPQAVNQARSAFEEKVRMAGATFLYGAMSGFFTADELDDLMYEVTEVAKFLLEVEGVELTVDEELDAEDRISSVMREVRRASEELRFDEVACPHCGEAFRPESED